MFYFHDVFHPEFLYSLIVLSKYFPQHPVHPQSMLFLQVADHVPHPYKTTEVVVMLWLLESLLLQVYRVCGMTVLCYPLIFEVSEFYLYRDMALLIDDIKTELQFVGRYWRLSGRPTVCLLIREEHMRYYQDCVPRYVL